MLVVIALWWTLRRRTRSVAELSAYRLDERDIALRNAGAWWGFTAALLAGCLSASALLITARVETLNPRAVLDRGGAVLLTLMVVAAIVPTMFLAATTETTSESDHEAEAEAEDEAHR